jgi:hypothetical protein
LGCSAAFDRGDVCAGYLRFASWSRETLRFTAAETVFISRLIEKDYFCTLVLQYFCASDTTLTFKGGTCLANVHADFCSARTRKDQPKKRCGDLKVEFPGLLVNSSKWRQCDFQQMEYRR